MASNIELVNQHTLRVYGRNGVFLEFQRWKNGQGESVVTVGMYGPRGGLFGATHLTVDDLRQAIETIDRAK